MINRTYIKDLNKFLGKEVMIAGWVDVRRDQGKMIFLDFRDMTGRVQGVILPSYTETLEIGKTLRNEFVVKVKGKVNERPEKNKKAREALRRKLKDLDFVRLQDSVWVTPHPCEDEVRFLREIFTIPFNVDVIETDDLKHHEIKLKKYFNIN